MAVFRYLVTHSLQIWDKDGALWGARSVLVADDSMEACREEEEEEEDCIRSLTRAKRFQARLDHRGGGARGGKGRGGILICNGCVAT